METKVIDMLYESATNVDSKFREAIPEMNGREAKLSDKLDDKILMLEDERRKEFEYLVEENRIIYEKIGFVSGLRTGMRLSRELSGR